VYLRQHVPTAHFLRAGQARQMCSSAPSSPWRAAAQIVGQVQGSDTDSQSKSWAKSCDLGLPCETHLRLQASVGPPKGEGTTSQLMSQPPMPRLVFCCVAGVSVKLHRAAILPGYARRRHHASRHLAPRVHMNSRRRQARMVGAALVCDNLAIALP
jgi:hypothetical protein